MRCGHDEDRLGWVRDACGGDVVAAVGAVGGGGHGAGTAADTLVWEPNFTAAANEDHKGYHGLLAAFLRAVTGEANDAPDIADGVRAMRVLEAVVRSMASGREERV